MHGNQAEVVANLCIGMAAQADLASLQGIKKALLIAFRNFHGCAAFHRLTHLRIERRLIDSTETLGDNAAAIEGNGQSRDLVLRPRQLLHELFQLAARPTLTHDQIHGVERAFCHCTGHALGVVADTGIIGLTADQQQDQEADG